MQSDSDARFWRRALDIKHQEKRLITRSEWEELLGEYAAVTDNSCCYFAEDLIAAYPEAKVVLQSRELDAWATSWIDTIARCFHDPVVKYLYTFHKDMVRWVPLTTKIHETYMGKVFRRETLIAEHKRFLEQVRGLVLKGRLLEWKVQDGWGPLCEFLKVEVPEEPFPNLFEKEIFIGMIEDMKKNLLYRAAWWYGGRVAAVAVVGFAAWWAWKE